MPLVRRRFTRQMLALLGVAAATTGVLTGGAAVAAAATTTSGSTIAAVQVATGGGGNDYSVALPVAGVGTRWYRLFVPSNLPPGPRPLIVAVHFFSGTATMMETMTGFDAGAISNGAIVAYPQGIGNSFNGGTCCGTARDTGVDDVKFIDAVLDDVESRYTIDTRKVAVGGYSNGAIMAYRYACERSSRVQWFFAGSGVEVAPSCSFSAPVNILHIHGLLDTTVPWAGTTTSSLFTNGLVPNVSSVVGGLAAADGCSGWTTTVTSALVTRYSANACRAGASYTVLTSTTLAHRWPTGAADLLTYGINATGATWAFLLGGWSKLG